MNRSRLPTVIAIALVVLLFGFAAQRVLRRDLPGPDGATEVIRFAHWQLESGLRDAFDQLARDYEALHPGVRVEQIAIPERVYLQWVRTQLVGGTASDLIQIGKGINEEMLARHFVPLTAHVEAPNPYNVGTPLEGVPLRDTIMDGLQSTANYSAGLLDHYGVGVSMFTVRMLYNRDLWRRLLGDTPPPRTFEEFVTICERVAAAENPLGRPILAVAGSRDNTPYIVNRLFGSQTQRLAQEIDLLRDLRLTNVALATSFLRDEWTLDHPAITRALEVVREAGQHFQPGFTQLGRNDASFFFVQGRALMIATGSWDSPGFRAQADFDIGVFDLPMPTRDHPRYGAQVVGLPAEADVGTGLSFGLTRQSAHPERALDFLRFLVSHGGNSTFARLSGWLPSVVGVEPAAEMQPFLPRLRGSIAGFDLYLFSIGPNAPRVVLNALNQLVGPGGSVDAYRATLAATYPAAVREDLFRSVRTTTANTARQDVILAALEHRQAHAPTADAATEPANDLADKIDELIEGQTRQEAWNAWIELELGSR